MKLTFDANKNNIKSLLIDFGNVQVMEIKTLNLVCLLTANSLFFFGFSNLINLIRFEIFALFAFDWRQFIDWILFFLIKESNAKSGESIKKLNEGLNLIEQQNDERGRQFEKIISAEIKQRYFNISNVLLFNWYL